MKKLLVLLSVITIFLSSCKHNTNADISTTPNNDVTTNVNQNVNQTNNDTQNVVITTNDVVDTSTYVVSNNTNITVNKPDKCAIFKNFNITSPTEFIYNAQETEPNFILLFPIDKISDIQTTYNKSIALGIFSADLIYSTSYQNSNYINKYYNTTLKLADDLGISGAFSQKDFEIIQNTTNFDTINYIINQSIQFACSQLNNSNAYDELPFIIYGGWLESVYLLSNSLIINIDAPEYLFKQLSNQSEIIDNIIAFLNQIIVDTDDYEVNLNIQNIITELKTIKKDFTTAYATSKYVLSKDELTILGENISTFRNNFNESADNKMMMMQQNNTNDIK